NQIAERIMAHERIKDTTDREATFVGARDRKRVVRLRQALRGAQDLRERRSQLPELRRVEQLRKDQISLLLVETPLFSRAELMSWSTGHLDCLNCHGVEATPSVRRRDTARPP